MARTSPTPHVHDLERPAFEAAVPRACLCAVATGVALGLLILIAPLLVGLPAVLSPGSQTVPNLLALHTAATPAGGILGATAVAFEQLLGLALLVSAASAVLLLLVGSALAVLEPDRRRSAHRITTTGLWLALLVALSAMLPIAGHPFAPSGGEEWHPALQWLAALACLGLLLAAISRDPRHPRVGVSALVGDTTDG